MARSMMVLGSCVLLAGCGVNSAGIADTLREKNMEQEREIASLRETVAGLRTANAALQSSTLRIPTIPAERLAEMYTAARIEFVKNTDAADWTGDKGLDGLRVFVRVRATDGTVLPATGTLTVEAFDLAIVGENQRLGEWTFTAEEMKKSWYSALGANYFAVNCPLAALPAHEEVTFRTKFVDGLTGSTMTAQMNKKISRK